jgi:hypothetical protein
MALDPITRLIEDSNRPEITARVAATKARCQLSPEDRQAVLRAATMGDDGSWLIETVEHLRTMAYYDGLNEGVDRASAQIQVAIAKYADNGEATAGTLPLVRTGPGGDFTTEYHG